MKFKIILSNNMFIIYDGVRGKFNSEQTIIHNGQLYQLGIEEPLNKGSIIVTNSYIIVSFQII